MITLICSELLSYSVANNLIEIFNKLNNIIEYVNEYLEISQLWG